MTANLNDFSNGITVSNKADSVTRGMGGLENVTALLAESDARLASVLESLGQALHGNSASLNKTLELNGSGVDLTSLADDIAAIAARSNLLALNAAIEAAWVGATTHGSSVSA